MSTVMEGILEVVLVIDDGVEGLVRAVRKIFLSSLDVIHSVRFGLDLSVEYAVPDGTEHVTSGLAQKSALVQVVVSIVFEVQQPLAVARFDDDVVGKDREVALQVEVEPPAVTVEVDPDFVRTRLVGGPSRPRVVKGCVAQRLVVVNVLVQPTTGLT